MRYPFLRSLVCCGLAAALVTVVFADEQGSSSSSSSSSTSGSKKTTIIKSSSSSSSSSSTSGNSGTEDGTKETGTKSTTGSKTSSSGSSSSSSSSTKGSGSSTKGTEGGNEEPTGTKTITGSKTSTSSSSSSSKVSGSSAKDGKDEPKEKVKTTEEVKTTTTTVIKGKTTAKEGRGNVPDGADEIFDKLQSQFKKEAGKKNYLDRKDLARLNGYKDTWKDTAQTKKDLEKDLDQVIEEMEKAHYDPSKPSEVIAPPVEGVDKAKLYFKTDLNGRLYMGDEKGNRINLDHTSYTKANENGKLQMTDKEGKKIVIVEKEYYQATPISGTKQMMITNQAGDVIVIEGSEMTVQKRAEPTDYRARKDFQMLLTMDKKRENKVTEASFEEWAWDYAVETARVRNEIKEKKIKDDKEYREWVKEQEKAGDLSPDVMREQMEWWRKTQKEEVNTKTKVRKQVDEDDLGTGNVVRPREVVIERDRSGRDMIVERVTQPDDQGNPVSVVVSRRAPVDDNEVQEVTKKQKSPKEDSTTKSLSNFHHRKKGKKHHSGSSGCGCTCKKSSSK